MTLALLLCYIASDVVGDVVCAHTVQKNLYIVVAFGGNDDSWTIAVKVAQGSLGMISAINLDYIDVAQFPRCSSFADKLAMLV